MEFYLFIKFIDFLLFGFRLSSLSLYLSLFSSLLCCSFDLLPSFSFFLFLFSSLSSSLSLFLFHQTLSASIALSRTSATPSRFVCSVDLHDVVSNIAHLEFFFSPDSFSPCRVLIWSGFWFLLRIAYLRSSPVLRMITSLSFLGLCFSAPLVFSRFSCLFPFFLLGSWGPFRIHV